MNVPPTPQRAVEPEIAEVPQVGLSKRDDSLINDHVIGRADMKRTLQALRDSIDDPNQGLFGPDSVMWKLLEPLPVLPFMLVNAGLIEGLHPKVIFGNTNATSMVDPGPRFFRSYEAFSDWFVGDVDTAFKTARKVHGYHSRIGGPAPATHGNIKQGDEYAASEEDLMFWNMATMVIPLKLVYEKLERPLTAAEHDKYWDECRDFAKLFGISEAILPDSWDGLMEYFDKYAKDGHLEVTTADTNGGILFDQSSIKRPNRWLVQLFYTMHWHLMPDAYRAYFEPYTKFATTKRRWLSNLGWGILRTTFKVLPNALSTMPRLANARRRVGVGKPATRLEKWWHSKLQHPFGDKQPSLGIPSAPEHDPAKSGAFTRVPAP